MITNKKVTISCNKSMANIASSYSEEYSNCVYMNIDYSYDLFRSFGLMNENDSQARYSKEISNIVNATELVLVIDETDPFQEFFACVCIYLARRASRVSFLKINVNQTAFYPKFSFHLETLCLKEILDIKSNIYSLYIRKDAILCKNNNIWYALHESSLDSYIIPQILESKTGCIKELAYDVLVSCRDRYHFLFSFLTIYKRVVHLCLIYRKSLFNTRSIS